MDHRARVVLSLFAKKNKITTQDAAFALGLSTRMVRILLKKWTEDKWLIVADSSNRGRTRVIGNLSAIHWQNKGIFSMKVTAQQVEFTTKFGAMSLLALALLCESLLALAL